MAGIKLFPVHIVVWIWGLLYCGVILSCLAVTTRETSYTTIVKARGNSRFEVHSNTTSPKECAVLCTQNTRCITFDFDEKTRACRVSSDLDPNTDNTAVEFIIDAECPVDKNYTLYRYDEILLCIKISSTKVNQSTAEGHCNNDGGHLLLITNATMHMMIKDILNFYDTSGIWLDGRDRQNNNTLMTYNGMVVPYFKWVSGEPDNNVADCLRLSSGSEFDFRDAPCDGLHLYVCQLELM